MVVSEMSPHQSGIMAIFVGSNSTLFTDAYADLLANSSNNENDDFMVMSHCENLKY